VLRQLVELIPGHLVPTFARECGIHLQARLFSVWSHSVSIFLAWQSGWAHSFARLNDNVRATLWLKRDLWQLLASYGTAGGDYRSLEQPEQRWLRGFEPEAMGQQRI